MSHAHPFRASLSAFATFCLSLSLFACGGGDPDPVDQTDLLALVVDANNGSDADLGTTDAPFKTITHALNVVEFGGVIHVRNGLYDEANGEVFPLRVPTGIHLAGPASSRITGTRPMIMGAGSLPDVDSTEHATLVPGTGSTVSALHLMIPAGSPDNGAVIAARFASTTIRSCVIEVSTFAPGNIGIWVMDNGNGLVVQNSKIFGASTGLMFAFAGHSSSVERTIVRGNVVGVRIVGLVTEVDLGGGSQSSSGNNVLAGNAIANLHLGSGITLFARNNYWDGKPEPTRQTVSNMTPGGVDVWLGVSDVDTTGALSDEPIAGAGL